MKEKKGKKIERIDAIIFLISFIIWGLALLSFFPGLVTSDSIDQINQALTNTYFPAHPIIHSFLIGNLTRLGGERGIWVPALFQIIVFSVFWTYSCKVLRKYNHSNKNRAFQIIITIIITLIPLNFLYSITIWKDILYSYNFILLLLFTYVGIREKYNYTFSQIVLISLSCMGIMKFRLNGFPIGLFMFALLLILNFVKNRNKKQSITFIVSFVIFYLIFTIPTKIVNVPHVKASEGNILNTTKVYCIGALLNSDITLEKEEEEFLDTILDVDVWRENYDPYTAAGIFYNPEYNNNTLTTKEANEKLDSIFKKYAKQKPKVILKHFLKVNSIWWSVKEHGGMHSVILSNEWVHDKNDGLYDTEPILKAGNEAFIKFTFKTMTTEFRYNLFYRPAVVMIISFVLVGAVCIKNKKGSYLLILLPMIMNVGTYIILISSQDHRYFYPSHITAYVLMLIFGTEFIGSKINNNKEKNEKIENKEPKTLVIVPAYNEAQNIEKTIKDLKENSDYDYIIINDCSKDNTLEICRKNNFEVLSLPVNYGLTSGIQLGMKYALENGYDIAIQFDGDGQHQARYLKDLVKEIKDGNCEIAIGSRFVTEKKPKSMRMLGSNIISACIKLTTDTKINDPTSGMRAYNKEIIEYFVKDSSLTPEPDTIAYLIKKGKRVKEVQVQMKDREFGESYLKPLKAAEYMTNIISSILFFRNFQE